MTELSLEMPIVRLACAIGFTVILAMVVLTVVYIAYKAVGVPGWIRRRRGLTRALRCDRCANNIDGRCELWGRFVVPAPVNYPGCTWGIRRDE